MATFVDQASVDALLSQMKDETGAADTSTTEDAGDSAVDQAAIDALLSQDEEETGTADASAACRGSE